MERRGVLIEAGVVLNIILWSDESKAQYEAEGWDCAMETTHLEIQPSTGWSWSEKDGFRPPNPYPSWTWDNVAWIAPAAEPSEGGPFTWNEETQSWDAVTPPEA